MIEFKPGQIFCTQNPQELGELINFVQKIKASNSKSEYTHVGIIKSYKGHTFESAKRIGEYYISQYYGARILIGQHDRMDMRSYLRGYTGIQKFDGHKYPFHRLLLHLIPGGAKFINSGKFPECSALVDIFLRNAGIIDEHKGRTPDNIADMIRLWKGWSIIFEGVLI